MNARAAITHQDTPVTVRRADAGSGDTAVVVVPDSGVDLEAIERALIVFAREMTHGNRTRAAHFLRVSRSALLYRMQKHGLAGPAHTDKTPFAQV
jgi:two-component system NtrC family response regulator